MRFPKFTSRTLKYTVPLRLPLRDRLSFSKSRVWSIGFWRTQYKLTIVLPLRDIELMVTI